MPKNTPCVDFEYFLSAEPVLDAFKPVQLATTFRRMAKGRRSRALADMTR
jgi:hypothetical protein